MLQVAHATLSAGAALCVLAAMCNRGLVTPERLVPWILGAPISEWNAFEERDVLNQQNKHAPDQVREYREALVELLLSHRRASMPLLDDDCVDARRSKRGFVWRTLKKRATRGWSVVTAACLAVMLWRRWQAYMCEPGSGYIQRVVARRFNRRAHNWLRSPSSLECMQIEAM